jgi:hypothetical protein
MRGATKRRRGAELVVCLPYFFKFEFESSF